MACGHSADEALRLALAGGTIIVSWFLLHTVFAIHYAHEFYGEGRDQEIGGPATLDGLTAAQTDWTTAYTDHQTAFDDPTLYYHSGWLNPTWVDNDLTMLTDPTVIYGIRDFNGNITKEDLLTPTPYNTYVIAGLPPGPISNPGMSALTAALFPEQSTYLYFVGNGAGRHIFSTNLADHNSAVNEFQRGGSGTTQAPQAPPTETTPIAAQPTAQPPAQQSTAPAAP